jgi:Bacterial CdiA-CT RNAse A domain
MRPKARETKTEESAARWRARSSRFQNMTAERPVTLQQVKGDWLRVQAEMAWVRMLITARAYRKAVERKQAIARSQDALVLASKYSPDQPRVSAGQSGSGQWTDGGGGGRDSLIGGSGNDGLAKANDPKKYSVNLVEEDARGGHTVRDHVAKSDAELIGVVERSVIKGMFVSLYKDAQGSFLSLETANDLINQVLSRNQAQVDALASGALDEAWLPERFGYQTGKEAFRVRHDMRSDKGYRVHTAYPVNEKAK